MEPFRPTYAEIDLGRLMGNISLIKSSLNKGTKFMAVVKANAYGHGAVEVAKAAESAGADRLGVATLGEALEIRSSMIKTPVLILSETDRHYLERLFDADITPTVYTLETARSLSDLAVQKKKKIDIHIKIDTGMGRVGVIYTDAVRLVKEISALPGIGIEGIFTHFAKADEKSSDMTMVQFRRFTSILDELERSGIRPTIRHAANSAASVLFPETQLDMVRVGIFMYGLCPAEGVGASMGLKPVLSFRTKVLYQKRVPKGMTLSYGASYVTDKDTSIATLPVGYADGVPRSLSNKGCVLINGKRYPIAGKVTMDMVLIDTGDDKINIGDDAVVIGQSGDASISADEVASMDGTINYEVLCGIAKRVPRVYVQ